MSFVHILQHGWLGDKLLGLLTGPWKGTVQMTGLEAEVSADSRHPHLPPPVGAQGSSEAVSRRRGNEFWQAKVVAVYYNHLACILSINSIFSPMNKYIFYKTFLLPSTLITLVSAFALLCLEDPVPHHDQVIPTLWSPAQLLSFLGSSPCPRAFKIGSLLH